MLQIVVRTKEINVSLAGRVSMICLQLQRFQLRKLLFCTDNKCVECHPKQKKYWKAKTQAWGSPVSCLQIAHKNSHWLMEYPASETSEWALQVTWQWSLLICLELRTQPSSGFNLMDIRTRANATGFGSWSNSWPAFIWLDFRLILPQTDPRPHPNILNHGWPRGSDPDKRPCFLTALARVCGRSGQCESPCCGGGCCWLVLWTHLPHHPTPLLSFFVSNRTSHRNVRMHGWPRGLDPDKSLVFFTLWFGWSQLGSGYIQCNGH